MRQRALALVVWAGLLLALPHPAAQVAGDGTLAPGQSGSAQKYKHDGGKDDIEAIGNRKIGGGGLGNWYSLESEMRIGREYALQVEASARLLRDPVINEYVNRIGQNLVRNSDARVPFTFKIIDSDEINAFSVPGGFLYVHYGLLLATEDEAELAGVMAHEIAHVAARHATRQMTRREIMGLASLATVFVGGPAAYAAQQALRLGAPLTMLKFSRGFENEADYLGLQYMYKTGYDPQALIAFLEKIQATNKSKPGVWARAFANHPSTSDRIKKSQAAIAKVLPPRTEYLVSTSEFAEIKLLLARIKNHRIWEGGHAGPTLRRRAPGGETGSSGTEDEHPTLKRRPKPGN